MPDMFNSNKTLAVLACISLLVAACGTGDGGSTTTQSEPTTTTAESTTTSTETSGIVPGENAEVDAIVAVYSVVFDSTTSFEEKSALIDDPAGLEDTVAAYEATGASVGGVTAEPTAVAVNGAMADVVYTLFFSGNPTYPDLDGTAVLTDDGWQVTREMFCSVMASARSACPTG